MAGKCEECGCVCAKCTKNNEKHADMHLHAEIENLRQRLIEKDSHIVKMETQFFSEADKFPNGQLASMKEETRLWQEKYTRLYEAHKRVQKVNQNLEDKLLRIVDKCETEKGAFAKDIATLSHRLADANYTIHRLTQDNEKYRNDVNLAIQLLQCKPSNFVGQKYDSLPSEVQAKVRTYVAQKRRSSDASPPDVRSITVPISTFPPTAMVYNITKANVEKHSDDESDDSKPPVDVVSAAIMAKVLEDRERERIFAKHCNTCTCHRTILTTDSETQTCPERYDARVREACGSSSVLNDRKNRDEVTGTSDYRDGPESTSTMTNFRHANEAKTTRRRIDPDSTNNAKTCAIVNHVEAQSRVTRQATTLQKYNQHTIKGKLEQPNNERSTLVKSNLNRNKQIRFSKRVESDSRTYGTEHWKKLEKNNVEHADERSNDNELVKELSPVDIINDRIWKSGWSTRSQLNANGMNGNDKRKAETAIDVINDRVWRNDRTNANEHRTQMTLIEVTNVVNSANAKDFNQTEAAISPSFSSDSVVISTSNQSSSSSDALHALADKSALCNSGKILTKERSHGPRNCFMRVTPGSKNILLDNVGHYQTVLYTSGNNRPNTALVHVAKSTRSGRSMSTSSEENSPMVTGADSTQLQRVAEWVQSSVDASKTEQTNGREKNTRRISSTTPISVNTLVKIGTDERLAESANLEEIIVDSKPQTNIDPFSDGTSVPRNDTTLRNVANDCGVVEDLITFETCNNTDESSNEMSPTSDEMKDPNYEVKITKEMEEIYLKLAASLDPVSLRLSNSSSADLTIENYRKDHRRIHVQKSQDKSK